MFVAKQQLLNNRLPTEFFASKRNAINGRRDPIAWFYLIKDENLQEMKLRLFVSPCGVPEADLDRFELWVRTMIEEPSESEGD